MNRFAPALPVALLAVGLLLSGCPTGKKGPRPPSNPPPSREKEVSTEKGVTVEDDQGKSRIRFIGEKARYGRGTGVYLLRSWLERKSGALSHQVYVTDRYLSESARHWMRATDSDGKRLKFTLIDNKVENCGPDGCPRMEAFGAAIEDAGLRAAAKRGYTIEFGAQDGTKASVTVTPDQIRDQLAAIDRKRATLPPPTASAPKHKATVKRQTKAVEPVPSNTGY